LNLRTGNQREQGRDDDESLTPCQATAIRWDDLHHFSF
jgi:hypothetical protein